MKKHCLAIAIVAGILLSTSHLGFAQKIVFKDAKWPDHCRVPQPTTIAQNVPAEFRPFLALSGWWVEHNGTEELCYHVVLTEVQPNGEATAEYLWGSSTNWRANPGKSVGKAKIDGNVLTLNLTGTTPIVITHTREQSGWVAGYQRGSGSVYKAKHIVEGSAGN